MKTSTRFAIGLRDWALMSKATGLTRLALVQVEAHADPFSVRQFSKPGVVPFQILGVRLRMFG